MAEMAVKQEIKKEPIKYKRNDNKEEETLNALVKERDEALGKAKAEEEDKAETESLAPEEKTFKKRYGDLRRHSQEKEKSYQDEIFKLKEQLSQTAKKEINLPKSDEEIEKWSQEYPDVAKIVESIATKKAQELDSSLEERMKLIAEKEASASRARAEAELMSLHPDFEDIRNDQQFHDWVDTQPRWVQQALYENETDSKSAARAIDLYKVDMGLTEIKKKKATNSSKEAAKAVTKATSSAPSPTKEGQPNQIRESDVAKMKGQEFEKNEEAIKEAIRSGNFIYDISRPSA
jgi:DNA repair exonuclease SbcCD ATPase subunit|tara:strand:- start:1264 stop:2136 length:873 start_codon:yes stop_codon:yes gene_type:complete